MLCNFGFSSKNEKKEKMEGHGPALVFVTELISGGLLIGEGKTDTGSIF